ncbi:DinB family protein [Allorhodopirellula heiligendammensis]|uniref:DinB superfamily protein n=1 Tax=Allorhodopirellula heiligendammensis TaxID=2714739 RepID=A0A5C6BW31_9BACT|nr:DinB family protein [Allorhodopirellula heiligendammensis]TWU16483.1 hypothetical protein Poly21_36880 [Allorhodopirellula heiligendammensis]|tara:strand:- start:241 stop:756 length:516 start_codon:yes stop_codon:yes gene_type:complete
MIGSMIADSATMGMGYAERLLQGIPASQFGRFAEVNGQTIHSNHPAFIIGHLSLYPSRVVAELGGNAEAINPSSQYESLFSPSASCVDDPDATIYPAMDEITEKFFTAQRAAIETLRASDDSLFPAETPLERMRAKFPTIGSLHAFYLGGHVMMHLGQLSAWRRAMGMDPA